MPHNNRIRASAAAWNAGALTPAELEALDLAQFRSINETGGVWAPTTAIVIGGAGIEVDGPLRVDGNGIFAGDYEFLGGVELFGPVLFSGFVDFSGFATSFSAGATFDGAAVFNAAATFNGHATIGNASADLLDVRATMTVRENATFNKDLLVLDDIVVTDDITASGQGTFGSLESPNAFLDNLTALTALIGDLVVSDDLLVQDDLTVDSSAHIGNNLTVANLATFNGMADFFGGMTLRTKLNHEGLGRVALRSVTGPNSDHTYSIDDCNCVFAPALSSSRDYTIDDTNAQNGDFFLFAMDRDVPAGRHLTIRAPGGSRICDIIAEDGVFFAAVLVVRVAGTWVPMLATGTVS